MANKGKYYESQFEEATIALLREAHWQYTFGDDTGNIPTHSSKRILEIFLPLNTKTRN